MTNNGTAKKGNKQRISDSAGFNSLVAGVLALEDKFEYLYDVNIQTGNYSVFVNEQTAYESINLHYVGYEDFFCDSKKNIEEVIFPDDRETVRRILDREYIRKHLEKDKRIEYYCRLIIEDRPVWFRTRITYRDRSRQNIILGIFNADEEMLSLQKDAKLRGEMINQMLGGESVYLVNPGNGDFKVIYRNRYLSETYGDDEKFSVSVNKYINSDVYEPDRARLRRVVDLKNLEARLNSEHEIEELYRDVSCGVANWYKMRAIRISDEEILMGFANVDKEYLDKAIHKRIEEEFFAMFAVDFESQTVKVLKNELPIDEVRVGEMIPYSKLLDLIASKYEGATKAFFNEIGDIGHVRKSLTGEGKVSYTYKANHRWITAECIAISRDNAGTVKTYALGFRYTDYLAVEKEELQVKLNANRIVLEKAMRKEVAIKEQLQKALTLANSEKHRRELEAINAKLRADALAYISEHEQKPGQFLDFFSERILETFHCDQVLFRDMNGKRIVHNAPGVEDVPPEICKECPFSKFDGEEYRNGIVVLNDCRGDYCGVHPHPDCQVKSSVMQQVYTDGKVSGLISLHYLKEFHSFSDEEIEMLKTIAGYLGIIIGRLETRRRLAEESAFTSFFLEPYVSAYYINLNKLTWRPYKRSEKLQDEYPTDERYIDSLGRYIENEIHPDDREQAKVLLDAGELKRRLAKQTSFTFSFRKISEKNERVIQCDVVRGADKNHVALGFMDITERVRNKEEEERKLKEALANAQTASAAKTAFLNNMSHDIRTPMNAIMGFTNMAKRHIDDREKIEDCLEKIQESGHVLLALINSVLEVSRIESGHAVLERQYGDIYYSFTSIESTMRELAQTKDVKLEFRISDITDRYVYVDIARCMRIFVNVISNAIKYTPAGGEVKVTCEQLGEAQNGYARYRYTVTDNGIGMSEEFQKHVFDQFARERNATISGIQGTGLGMAVCKSFVGLMNGTIECKSRKGEGTTFTIVLPFEIQTENKYTDPFTGEVLSAFETARDYSHVEFSGEKVLLVEDNELNREIAVEILEEEGLCVEEAENGQAAVSRIRDKGPDYYSIILMDIQMPVMNGYMATKAIRELYPEKHIPIIALSANAFGEDRMAALEADMDGHIAKPIVIHELLSTLKKFI